MSTLYTATIRHHSVSRARHITGASLSGIKRAATKEFGGEQQDFRIVVLNDDDVIVSERRVGDARWTDRP